MSARPRDPRGTFEPDLHIAQARMAEDRRRAQDGRLAAAPERRGGGILAAIRNRLGFALIALGRVLAAADRPVVSRPVRRP